jgi:hypothetical protein
MIDQYIQIDELIRAIRQRMRMNMNKEQIARDLDRFVSQDLIYLCYEAAKIMEENTPWYVNGS